MRRQLFAVPALLTLLFGAFFIQKPIALAKQASDFRVFDPVADVYFEIEERFYREIDPIKLQRGMIRGMLEALDDPYTEYIPPANLDDFDKNIRGEYVGIGAEVNTRDGFMIIVSPMDDSPAYNAGIEADDLIVAIDGESTFDRELDEIITVLTGTPGTSVTVTVQREGDESDLPDAALPASVPGELGDAPGPAMNSVRFDLEIVRRRIVTSTVKGVHRVDDRWSYIIDPERMIGYVRVTQFTGGTIPELVRACTSLVEQGMTGLILDLRCNRGGSLSAAVRMADLFIADGLIVSTKGRQQESEERAYARKQGTLPDFPMVVLVNGQSASASEVVAGALADNDRAIILGERTFGKGIVQSVIPLKSGEGHLKVTEQDYYVPSGRSIQREDDSVEWGVDPDPGFYMPMTNPEYREMLRIRRQYEIIRDDDPDAGNADWSDPEWILSTLKDAQLSSAVTSIRTRLDDGEWKPTGEDAPEGTLELAALRDEEVRYELLLKELARSQQRIESLSTAAAESDEDPFDLVPGEEDISGGVLTLRDAEGNVVAEFDVGVRSLDRWLWDAPIVLIETPDEGEEDKEDENSQ